MNHRLGIAAFLYFIAAARTGAAQFVAPNGKTVAIDLPVGWSAKEVPGKEGALEFSLVSDKEKKMKCQVSVLRAPPPADERLMDPEKLRTTVAVLSQLAGIQAAPVGLPTQQGIGCYSFDKGRAGMAMVTPVRGVSVTIHFSGVKDWETLRSILCSIRVEEKPEA